MVEILGVPVELLVLYLLLLDTALLVAVGRRSAECRCECPECPEPEPCPEPREPYPTAYRALRELAGCKGTLVVEPKRVVCLEGDESGRLIWPKTGIIEEPETEGVIT